MNRKSIKVGIQERTYKKSFLDNGNAKHPLLFILHGGGETAVEMLAETISKHLIAMASFRVIFPQGITNHWNDARDVTAASQLQVDDIAFLNELVNTYNPENQPIYLIGFSNGGLMAQTFASHTEYPIQGMACISALLPENLQETHPNNNLKQILYVHGTNDPIIPYAGGIVRSLSGGKVLSVNQTIHYWQQSLGESSFPIKEIYPKVLLSTISSRLQLITIIDGGHQIPGSLVPLPQKTFGNYNPFDSIKYILEQFKTINK